MANTRIDHIVQGMEVTDEPREYFRTTSQPVEIPQPATSLSSLSDEVASQPERGWKDSWIRARDVLGRACALKCSAISNDTFSLEIGHLIDLTTVQRYESLLEQQSLSVISELPDEYTVILIQSAFSFSAEVMRPGVFPNLSRRLFPLMESDTVLDSRCRLVESAYDNGRHSRHRWYRKHSGLLKRSAAESLRSTQTTVPLH